MKITETLGSPLLDGQQMTVESEVPCSSAVDRPASENARCRLVGPCWAGGAESAAKRCWTTLQIGLNRSVGRRRFLLPSMGPADRVAAPRRRSCRRCSRPLPVMGRWSCCCAAIITVLVSSHSLLSVRPCTTMLADSLTLVPGNLW